VEHAPRAVSVESRKVYANGALGGETIIDHDKVAKRAEVLAKRPRGVRAGSKAHKAYLDEHAQKHGKALEDLGNEYADRYAKAIESAVKTDKERASKHHAIADTYEKHAKVLSKSDDTKHKVLQKELSHAAKGHRALGDSLNKDAGRMESVHISSPKTGRQIIEHALKRSRGDKITQTPTGGVTRKGRGGDEHAIWERYTKGKK
jgi:hypothetical protein